MRLALYRLIAGAVLWLGIGGCDHGLEATPPATGIAGRVTFVGTWPEDVEEVAVAVYPEVPQTLADFFTLAGADTQVELGALTYDYFVSIETDGTYRWIVVVWRKKGSFWDFRSLLGCYSLPGEERPRRVDVRSGEVIRGIDIAVDFGVLRGETVSGFSVCERPLPADLLAAAGGQ